MGCCLNIVNMAHAFGLFDLPGRPDGEKTPTVLTCQSCRVAWRASIGDAVTEDINARAAARKDEENCIVKSDYLV